MRIRTADSVAVDSRIAVSAPPDLPADLDHRIRAALRRERVDDSYAAFVHRHLHDRNDHWRFCCGSRCDPCAKALARVVDGLRRDLGIAIG